MFERSAHLYDLIYRDKDYAGEAAAVEAVIRARAPRAASLLDVACGTGRHLEAWLGSFERIEGLDLDPILLELARARLPGVELHEGTMIDFDLGRRYDALTCLFSAIGYARRPHYMRRAIESMARHLEPGGVLVIEPWFGPDQWMVGHVGALLAEGDEIAVSRIGVAERDGDLSAIEMFYTVGTPQGVTRFEERHELGLFRHEHYVGALESAGLTVEHDPAGPTGRGLYVATRPAA